MYEYKVVPAPSRVARVKGLKTTAERFAHALAERINAEAAGGWQFVRSEAMPCEERTRLGGTRQSQQVVMIFARELGARRPDAAAALAAVQNGKRAAPVLAAAAMRKAAVPVRANPVPAADEDGYETAYEEAVDEAAQEEPAPAAASAPAAPARRQEPLFRSGAMLRAENARRVEPVLRPRAVSGDKNDDDDGA